MAIDDMLVFSGNVSDVGATGAGVATVVVHGIIVIVVVWPPLLMLCIANTCYRIVGIEIHANGTIAVSFT